MAKSALLDQRNHFHTERKIFVDGSELPNSVNLDSIEVHKEINRITIANLYFLVDKSFRSKEYKEAQEMDIAQMMIPGKTIEVKMGYKSESVSTIFKGIIIKVGIRIRGSEYTMYAVECADKAVKMTLDRRNKYFLKKKDHEIINAIIGTYGLDKEVKDTNYLHKEVVQYNCTDWDFIVSRAELNGRVVINDENKIKIKKLEEPMPPISLRITQTEDIIKANILVNGKSQLKKVKASSWDMQNQEIIFSESSEPGEGVLNAGDGETKGPKLANDFLSRDYEMHITGPVEKPFLKEWANAKLIKSRLSRVTGTIQVNGMSEVKPDTRIKIKNIGKSYDGEWYISRVSHDIREGHWITELTIGMPNEWFAEVKPNVNSNRAAAMLPGIDGLYNGVVKKIHDDPDGDYRILVDVPVIIESGDGIWARLANFYATNNSGDFFYPEVGDEVILGFLNGDPQYPIILGSMYSKKNVPPYEPNSDNDTKAIVSRDQLKIIFEEIKKNLIIETPGGRRITLSDEKSKILIEDPFDNTITMNSSGIKIKSARGKIEMNAFQDITMDSTTGNIKAKAMMDIKLEATMNVSISGMLQAEFKGTVSTSLGSSACPMTSVKGVIVMLN